MIPGMQVLWHRYRGRNESGGPKLRVAKNYKIGQVIGQGRLGVVHKNYEIGEVIEQGRWRRCRAGNEEDSKGSGRPKLCVEKDYEIREVIGQGRLGVVHKNYEIREVIGAGRLGVVNKCIHRTTGQEFACKRMPATIAAFNEMTMLQSYLSVGNPGILKVRDCYWAERVSQFSWSNNVYMISELCDGADLQRFVVRNGIPSEREAARIMKCVMEALRYCHSQNIIHRDVKSSSIFVSNTKNSSSSCVVKLGNFDRSIRLTERIVVVNENVGTAIYSAPEMLIGNGYSYEVDIWSAGVVLYVLLSGRTPFFAMKEAMMMFRQIQITKLHMSNPVWSTVSDSAKKLVLGMLQQDPTRRLSCNQVLNHPWILGNAEMDVASSATISREIASSSGDDAQMDFGQCKDG